MAIIFKIFPKSTSYELLLALRCFVNMGPGHDIIVFQIF